jgi:hypothetical protein
MRHRYFIPVAIVAAVSGITAVVSLASAEPSQVNACYSRSTGVLRISTLCRFGEAQLSWNAGGQRGPAGPAGLRGARGIAGADGAAGQIGPAGNAGAAGAAGIAGPAGERGDVGLTGATGSAGSNGSDGAPGIGTTGATGATGHTGATGATGATGTGATGPAGATGATGAAGGMSTYTVSGVQQVGGHVVIGSVTVPSSGSTTVMLTGSAGFTSASSYQCAANIPGNAQNQQSFYDITNVDGTHIQVTSNDEFDTVGFICAGN